MSTLHSYCTASAAGQSADETNGDGVELLQATLYLMGFEQPFTAPAVPALCQFIRHHGVAGLLQSDRAQSQAPECVAALKVERQRIALRALALAAGLKRLVTALTVHDLQPLALKGPALAVQAYGNLGARGGVDLDILLPSEQWADALVILQDMGYRVAPGQHWPLPDATHELLLIHDNQPRVELHRRLLRHQHLLHAPQQITQVLDLQGTHVTCLAPAYALPYLIAHANQHCFRRLIWLMDIHALLLCADLDHELLARQLKRSGTCAMLDTCLSLLTLLFGLQVPAPLQKVRRPCQASREMVGLALEALRGSLSDDQVATGRGFFKRVRLDIALQDTFSARWQALTGWLSPTAKDYQWLVLPRGLSFLYPCVRLLRLALRKQGREA
ncbi:nucleotidyltransferase family protein [Pseudomonas vanderleydeniana]|uniref:Nucleotidyltransferase family protein n=1 Tax=Pseudomonas vanderleydeniana TaxID=2745495 RepID=A0A9E6TQ97_9PSED|nr:nucleotidyltransferase family protein [Pseudomonas vanderleydeniana]QXI26276.1 nucleotidyltransferase family protein [Pseudomonas vanderleydeniana]